MKSTCFIVFLTTCFFYACNTSGTLESTDIFVEAEQFDEKGGWVVDNQSMIQMGSPYLMAHGLGVPVANASTNLSIPHDDRFRVWVRTRNWVKQWKDDCTPGKFEVCFNGTALDSIFGVQLFEWHWQDGGYVELKAGNNKIELHDITGFNGRCDAIYLTTDFNRIPPGNIKELTIFREQKQPAPSQTVMEGADLVVVGGGIAGCCAAISAARLGCKVVLIQNRPILGGNNSSEVRVGLSGLISQQPYPNLGNLMDELGTIGYWNYWEARQTPNTERSKHIFNVIEKYPEKKIHNAGPASNYGDDQKEQLIKSEKNIDLFLNVQAYKVEKEGNTITSVTGKNILTGEEYRFKGRWFADCTGDGTLGFLAGADYRMGRESRKETGEPRAPEKADQLVMGTSIQWYAEETEVNTTFPACPWAIRFDEQTCCPGLRGDWDWETGMNNDQITEIESIRDYALRAVFGNWDFLKNRSEQKDLYANKALAWVAYIGGKRESRRLLGDMILKEQDVLNRTVYEDASFTTTWGIDLHYPKELPGMQEAPFLSYADVQDIEPYAVPYRCLYSRNIDNLFMAGRNISVTHVALGSVRVMRTGGMMGEVVGMAASICKKYDVNPRQVYLSYLPELKRKMEKGVGNP
ncbi:MAG: FAD-dependent oxidoreductase [Tannerellaceae bacterium]|jgi:hypothetical protein|nr:FAD-dependent oxidoreductase [Tannerellaceae bacterium]